MTQLIEKFSKIVLKNLKIKKKVKKFENLEDVVVLVNNIPTKVNIVDEAIRQFYQQNNTKKLGLNKIKVLVMRKR